MPRPVKPRTARTYARDLESITRLRTAIALDPSVGGDDADKALAAVDALVKILAKLARASRPRKRAA